jgi:hypothetical protein
MRLWAALSLLLALAAGCASPSLAKLDSEDPDERREGVTDLACATLEEQESAEQRVAVAERARKLAHSDPNPAVRASAIRAAVKLGVAGVQPREAAQVCGEQLSPSVSKDAFVRLDAAEGLADLALRAPGDEATRAAIRQEALDGLKNALRADDDRDIRISAARSLGDMRANEAVPDLIQALHDETPDVRYHAERSLVKITGVDKGPNFEDWASWAKDRESGR